MKHLLFILTLLCGFAAAQIDIPIGQVGPYLTLANKFNWTGTGTGNINNNFIFTPTTPDQGVCFFVENNDVSTHPIVLAVWETGDPNVVGFQNNQGLWVQVVPSIGTTLNANSTYTYFIKASGAARLVVAVSGGTGAGTVTLLAVYTSQNCGTQSQAPFFCNLLAQTVISTGTSGSVVVPPTPSPQTVHVCSYMVTIGGATVTAATNTFSYATTCGTPIATVISLKNGAVPAVFSQAGAGQDLFPNLTAENGLKFCYTDGGTTSGSAVQITYALF